ncbi:tRNA (guanine-N(7)-)-methyltransferase [Pseudidiomarina planktonica]|uniref:tRNA (guanine-N(7)-)-methyltransferase n=1 Tax=Pseudidiomarina planktonica TaxID=1323738 RepID=A0A1Y6G2C1_9GAMM|nr:tRNA (guanosine(46)-N7)-methyltransferase TrmB [Pseudidiomarina planktonica]RUO62922.1 tRNA (guanosine(46)-N7)-methyltransferase TrmB [Pseudidiomarina planktonica]SMQ80814.1 tRNA (guanine-N(7)-)-methyltransferase [Pseudidiomarina planktonica]
MSKHASIEDAEASGKYIRRIRSFVKREGRLTKGQAGALERQWPKLGLEHQAEAIDLKAVFGRSAPVVLEIGFGMGKSLVEMAKAAPDQDFIGIEVHRPGVGACLLEAEEQQVENLRVYEHDAVEVLADCIADESLSTIQIFFPDPWHKKRHHKRRIIQPEFVQQLRKKLKPGGILHLATDWENYAEYMLEVMQAAEGFRNLATDNAYVPRPDHRPLTKFEARGQRLGHGVWDLQFERIA